MRRLQALPFPSVTDEDSPPLQVPHSELSAEALRGLVESFVLREGTDYGLRQYSFEEKVGQVLQRLQRGEAQILFDADTETVTIVAADSLRR